MMSASYAERNHQLIGEFLAFAGDYWERTLPKPIVNAWMEELAEYPPRLLEAAFKRARRNKFMPNIGDIVEIIENLAESERMSPINGRQLLDRGDKPPDWEQLTWEERAALYKKLKSRLEIVAQERQMPETKRSDPEEQFRKLQQQKAKLIAEERQKTMSDSEEKKRRSGNPR